MVGYQKHNFHLVSKSPWPFLISVNALSLTIHLVMYFHFYFVWNFLILSFVNVLLIMYSWWRDIIKESSHQGSHTLEVKKGLKLGFILFIISEVMFFVSWFWAFFHSSLSPVVQIGCVWPPAGIFYPSPLGLPLVNTIILLSSGVTITWSHACIVSEKRPDRKKTYRGLILTLLLGANFTYIQYLEYTVSTFSICDSIYGSTFYMLTGFHGFHVICGLIFLFICLIRFYKYHFNNRQHLGLEFAIWYWHFVDVVWLFVFFLIYCWGS